MISSYIGSHPEDIMEVSRQATIVAMKMIRILDELAARPCIPESEVYMDLHVLGTEMLEAAERAAYYADGATKYMAMMLAGLPL